MSAKTTVKDLPARKLEGDKAKQVKGGGIKVPDARGPRLPLQPCI
jgi:hypothetical protein